MATPEESKNENIYSLYHTIIDTNALLLDDEMITLEATLGQLMIFHKGDLYDGLTSDEYLELRSKDESDKVFDTIEQMVKCAKREMKEIVFNDQLTELNNVIRYFKSKEIFAGDYACFISDLELVVKNLQIRFNFQNLQIANVATNPKIKWLGNTNVLATLIYDLWQGQETPRKPKSKKMIDAQKKDLVNLLVNNFLDANGDPLSPSTIDTYLNSARENSRAGIGIRIEIVTP